MAGVVALCGASRLREVENPSTIVHNRLNKPAAVRSLAQIQAAGLVWWASEQKRTGVEHALPVVSALRPLLPDGLRRGGTVAVSPGCTSLLFALLAEASAAGSWCAAVGLPRLGLVAAAEMGVAVERLALVPHPGTEWINVTAALLDGVDIVVTAPPGPVPQRVASRLVARARQRGAVLIPIGHWPGADLTVEVVGGTWHGSHRGRGRLRYREVEVIAYGRGAAARPRRLRLWLPGPTAPVALVTSSTTASITASITALGLAG